MATDIDHIHIVLLQAGNTILHDGKVRTVCSKDLTHIEGMGPAVFGNTYRLGTKLVKRLEGFNV